MGKLTASCGRGSSSTGGLRGGWLSSDGGAARDAILVGQVGGGLAVTLGAGGLAVSDGVHGVGEELALGAAGVVGGRACEVVRICCGKRDGGVDDLQAARQMVAACWPALGFAVPETTGLSVVAVPLLA